MKANRFKSRFWKKEKKDVPRANMLHALEGMSEGQVRGKASSPRNVTQDLQCKYRRKNKSAVHKNCHPELGSGSHPLLTTQEEQMLKRVQYDNYFRRGFSLIELFVVVLIIGILAAVALPQYQKAVLKSRRMPVLLQLSSVKQAVETYVLENGLGDINFNHTNSLTIGIPEEIFASCFSSMCKVEYWVNHPTDPGSDWVTYMAKRDANGAWSYYCIWFYEEAKQECELIAPAASYNIVYDGDFDWW